MKEYLYVVLFSFAAAILSGVIVWFFTDSSWSARTAELEYTADRLERSLRATESSLRDAREVNRELTERQRAIEDVIDQSAQRLTEASRNAGSITELIDRSLSIVDELSHTLRATLEGSVKPRSP